MVRRARRNSGRISSVSSVKAAERFAICDDKWQIALDAPVQVLFYLSANIFSLEEKVKQAHAAGKFLMVHIDLTEGIGKDRAGIEFVSRCGVDGLISTRSNLIRIAKETGLATVQRCFALDSKGVDSIEEIMKTAAPHMVEIMPGVIGKILSRFRKIRIPVIAGGLVETKAEVTTALRCGAAAVSTGKQELWFL